MYSAIDANNSCDLLKHPNLKPCIHGDGNGVPVCHLYSVISSYPATVSCFYGYSLKLFSFGSTGSSKSFATFADVNFTYSLACMLRILRETSEVCK